MTTADNENIDFLNIPSTTIKTIYHLIDNTTLDDDQWAEVHIESANSNIKLPTICAKKTTTPQTNIDSYYVRCAESMMFDPYNNDVRYGTRPWWKLRKVNFRAYNLYIQFLSSKRKTLLHQAEREI